MKKVLNIAVLITCHNRKEKTLACLQALNVAEKPYGINLDVFLVDDGSTDGTQDEIRHRFPLVNVTLADGNLFWAGGMRLAYKSAIANGFIYDCYLLLNDDTLLFENSINVLIKDHNNFTDDGIILVGSTLDPSLTKISYGGKKLIRTEHPASNWVIPNQDKPQPCDLGNANIMLIDNKVVDEIGFLSDVYKHGIADYDYTLTAVKSSVPVLISSEYLGTCKHDHGNAWMPGSSSLKQRIAFLYSVKGLSYENYIYFIKKHFPKYVFEAKIKLWLKTMLPSIWDKFKK
jgi:GT2 family glycosyltransferase